MFLAAVFNSLNFLADQVACLFWLFHSDLHEMKASSALEYISSMVACVEPISNTANGKGMNSENVPLIEQNLGRGKFSVLFKRRNGRIRLMVLSYPSYPYTKSGREIDCIQLGSEYDIFTFFC